MKKKSALFIVILGLVYLLSACGSIGNNPATATPAASPNTVIAEGHLTPSRNQYMAFQVRGQVDQILVKNGEHVKQGQILVSLADRQQAQAALTAAQLAQTSAQQAFDTLNRTSDLGYAQAWQAYMAAQKGGKTPNWPGMRLT